MSPTGIYPIVPTPLDSSGGIDEGGIKRLTAFLEKKGTQGASVLGRLERPEEQAAAAFLASEPGGHVTGVFLILGEGACGSM